MRLKLRLHELHAQEGNMNRSALKTTILTFTLGDLCTSGLYVSMYPEEYMETYMDRYSRVLVGALYCIGIGHILGIFLFIYTDTPAGTYS